MKILTTILTWFMVILSVPAISKEGTADNKAGINTDTVINEKTGINEDNAYSLQKFDFGIAIGIEGYGKDYINEARTYGETRMVRVVDKQSILTSVWLETHYTWDGWAANRNFTHSAPGFYIGAKLLGEDSEVFNSFSMGVMWAFKRSRLDVTSEKKSINIGIGPVWHRTKELASGIVDGQNLPENYSDIEYKKRDEVSWMLMVSTGF